MAQSDTATLPDWAQLSSQIDERIKSHFDEQIKPLIKSLNEKLDQAKPDAGLAKAEVSGEESGGPIFRARIAVIVVGFSAIVSAAWFLGGLSSDVKHVDTQVQIRFDALDKRFDDVDKRFDDVNERLDKLIEQFEDFKERLIRIEERLPSPQQKQTE